MAAEIQGLSPKTKEVPQRNAEWRQRDNKFMKIGPGKRERLGKIRKSGDGRVLVTRMNEKFKPLVFE
jgi:hypothetical protein